MGSTEHRPCESSGSEHLAVEISLSDMINSFMENYFEAERDHKHKDDEEHRGYAEMQNEEREEKVDQLRRLVCVEDTVKSSLLAEVDKAKQALEDSRSRELMNRLRARGLDAGVCKSKWQKQGCVPAGDHEYIDIINTDNNTRYIVELSLVEQFTVARPTSHYASLLETLPEIYIGTVEEMKRVVKLMCKAVKVSMRCRDMEVPPWRKHEYMKAKWFGCYKRTTKPVSTKNVAVNNTCDRSVGFEVVVKNLNGNVVHSCWDEVSTRTRMEHGLLAAAFRA